MNPEPLPQNSILAELGSSDLSGGCGSGDLVLKGAGFGVVEVVRVRELGISFFYVAKCQPSWNLSLAEGP